MTTNDTQTCQRGHSESSDPAGDQMVQDVLAATAMDLDLDAYIDARAAGVGHEMAVKFVTKFGSRPELGSLLPKARSAGVSDEELLEVNTGHDMLRYLTARESGMSIGEFRLYKMHTEGTQRSMDDYLHARTEGVSHADICQYLQLCSISEVKQFCRNRALGKTHEEVIEMIRLGISAWDYSSALDSGATHAQVIEAYQQANLAEYTSLRFDNATHTEALAQLAKH
jgi:hypothetical protein